jgi:hypothetical protein
MLKKNNTAREVTAAREIDRQSRASRGPTDKSGLKQLAAALIS